ncbi:MAG TPA: glycosyl hydrolase 53 family protein [Cellvibrio sp.]|nr:glycosyl hydrolase 53 family protein [Cellvibrio sp.]
MSFSLRALCLAVGSALLVGCGGSGGGSDIPKPASSSPAASSNPVISSSSSSAPASSQAASSSSLATLPSHFILGADLSWVSEMEANGINLYNRAGEQRDPFVLVKELGASAIRLRVWVSPEGGWYNSLQDVVAKAKRAKANGQQVMIDFHYSDTWADPGKQFIPKDWVGSDLDAMKTALASHTRAVLLALKDEAITPTWVQVGNETNDGFLWDLARPSKEPRATTIKNYAELTNTGYDTVKEVFPDAKVIVHLANCHLNGNFRWIFDGLKNNGGKFDIIGASSYPVADTTISWQTITSDCLSNLNDMVDRYQVPVMLTEVGLPWDHTEAKAIISDLITKVAQVKNQQGLGVFYWEPLAHNGWKGYTLGAFDDSGKPAAAMEAFTEAAAKISAP